VAGVETQGQVEVAEMKRRTFISFLAATLTGAVRKALAWLGYSPLKDSTLDTLSAVVHPLLGLEVGLAHYREFFQYRAGRVPRYLELYERFERYLDGISTKRYLRDFRGCKPEQRRKVLEAFRAEHSRGGKWISRYHDHVILEILQLFANTDAWLMLGYDYWPGDPVGLQAYTKKIERAGR
jgi:hypothetical protein